MNAELIGYSRPCSNERWIHMGSILGIMVVQIVMFGALACSAIKNILRK